MTDPVDPTHEDPEAPPTRREGTGRREPEPQLERGTAVGRYIVIGVLGEGGMGVVYAAYDPELDRKVAVKLLQARPTSGSSGDQAWLLREAQAMARLSHPNVIAVYDVGSLPGDRVFVAMELVDGVTLRDWLKVTRKWREVLPVMLAAGAGLAAAHAAGLVHRDFKPDNVLVGTDGRVRVLDFGLARLRDDGVPAARTSDLSIETQSPLSASLTIAGTVVGTPAYMAPELYEGRAADARSDQFAFGVALYEALFRIRPFEKRVFAKRNDTPPKPKPPPDLGVPARVQRVVMRAISVAPEQRFAAMDDLLPALAIDPAARGRRIALGAAAVALVVAAGGAWLVMSHSRSQLCTGADRKLAGVWDSPTKQAVRDAFAATKQPFATPAFGGVERALDHYATEWTTASTQSCEATRIRGEQTEAVMTLRQDCFDQRLEELRALTQLLVHADAGSVERGDKAVFGLEPIKKCADVAALTAPNQPPPEVHDQVLELRKRVSDAKAQLLLGRYLAALTSSQAALDLAKQINFDSLAGEAWLVRAATLTTTGNSEDAAAASAEAVWAGVRGRRDDIVASGAFSAAMLTADTLGRPGEGKIWLALGDAAAARIGVLEVGVQKQQLLTQGVIAAGNGDMPAAVAAHEKALALSKTITGPESAALWSDEEMLAATLAKSGAYAKAVPHFEHALELREASTGPNHADVALLLSNLGTCYGHIGEPEKARKAYDAALAIREQTYGHDSPMLLATLNNMADTMRQTDPTHALVFIERAKAIAQKAPGTAHPMYHMVETTYGEILMSAGRLAEARTVFDELIPLEIKNQSPVLTTTQISRAELALTESKWAEAAAFDETAIATIEHASGKDDLKLWRPLADLAQAKLGLGKPDEARPLLERAIAIGEKAQALPSELAPARAALVRAQRP